MTLAKTVIRRLMAPVSVIIRAVSDLLYFILFYSLTRKEINDDKFISLSAVIVFLNKIG